jgi:hypothetical protein
MPPRPHLRRLLDQHDTASTAELDALPADAPHGALLIERLRFGPPETWRGWRRGDGAVAIKVYPDQAAMPALLPAMVSFRHPGVAPLLDWGPGWTVHAWADGRTLAAALKDGVAAPAGLAAAVADAVAALHAAGLAHGDLSPANIVITPPGPVLIDWGEPSLGTPGWRPEHPADARARDRFALIRLVALTS